MERKDSFVDCVCDEKLGTTHTCGWFMWALVTPPSPTKWCESMILDIFFNFCDEQNSIGRSNAVILFVKSLPSIF